MRRERRGDRDAEEDDFADTMLLAVLCVVISLLIYLRGRWSEQRRREAEQRRGREAAGNGAGNNNGLFPPPGDPARDEWAILR
ncbi:hypothetical protein SCHPADRAFT_906341 [Schizopora paradoxa]|uniref:Uncharacterized protein n=1 Tax=Schizopora paradoxa TaxID=27342 RepID=A0A0H2RHP3_9AGAM|nr:hypothetical protein SCHPADRAFT_906341 [Schizopora paradoxa]